MRIWGRTWGREKRADSEARDGNKVVRWRGRSSQSARALAQQESRVSGEIGEVSTSQNTSRVDPGTCEFILI